MVFTATVRADIIPAAFDVAAIRDPATFETRVIQDWQLVPRDPSVRQKVVEITVCEWWPGQRVRVPVTFNAPAVGGLCRHVIVANMGLAARPALPTGSALRLLKEHGVGVVLVGMSAIEAMAPAGKLHLGMKEQLLKTKDARFTPAWSWGMSDMRALTAAIAEADAFQPTKVLATGGSKHGVAAAVAGIHDDRFTAIMPVVAPPLGNPGGPYVVGTERGDLTAINRAFLAALAHAFALHHFFGTRPLIAPPKLQHRWNNSTRTLRITVTFPDGTEPEKNELWWSIDRHPPNTLPFGYDSWQSATLRKTGPATFSGPLFSAAGHHGCRPRGEKA